MNKEARIALREDRERKRLQKWKDTPRPKYYIWFLFVIIVLVNMLDEVSSSIGGTVTTNMVEDFFVRNPFFGKTYTLEEGIALNSTLGLLTGIIAFIAPFYKVLGDIIGRKPLFVISTFGMAFGMVLVFLSDHYLVYLLGATFISFFLGHDMQILYVLEEAPADKRTTLYSLAKGLGIFGTLAIPVLRNLLMGNDGTKWRNIYGIPGAIGLLFVLMIILFAKETSVFIEKRSAYLAIPREVRLEQARLAKEQAKNKQKSERKAGILPAIRYIFSHKQLRILMIAQITFCTAMIGISGYYQPTMNDAGMTTEQITQALVAYPLVFGTLTMTSGLFSDKFGRKKTICGFSLVCLITYVAFLISAYRGVNAYLVGVFYSLYIGSYWIGKDYIEIMMTENTPTDIRASVMAGANFVYMLGTAVGYILVLVGIQFLPIWLPCLITIVPGITVAVFMIATKVQETKGIAYDTIEDAE